jgi:hypothetical protein
MFFKDGGYRMILLLLLEAVVLPAAHPEKE